MLAFFTLVLLLAARWGAYASSARTLRLPLEQRDCGSQGVARVVRVPVNCRAKPAGKRSFCGHLLEDPVHEALDSPTESAPRRSPWSPLPRRSPRGGRTHLLALRLLCHGSVSSFLSLEITRMVAPSGGWSRPLMVIEHDCGNLRGSVGDACRGLTSVCSRRARVSRWLKGVPRLRLGQHPPRHPSPAADTRFVRAHTRAFCHAL